MRADDGSPVAAIDCGTNSTRLLIAWRPGDDLVRETRITRLGQGVDRSGALAADAMMRTLDVLADYRDKMDRLNVGRARLVATSAVRDAANGDTFLVSASKAIRVRAELLSGEEEGQLAFAGAMSDLPENHGDVMVDIGGGSTEVATQCDGEIHVISLDIGCVRLTERFLHQDPPTVAELGQARAAVRKHFERAARYLHAGGAASRGGRRLVGLAGTVTTMALLCLGLKAYDRNAVHHAVLSLTELARWCEVLVAERAKDRARRWSVITGREDVITAGALILLEAMRAFGASTCLVSEADLLDGLVRSLLETS